MGDIKRKKDLFEENFTYSILWIIRGLSSSKIVVGEKTDSLKGKLPVDNYPRQVFNNLPVDEAKKIIENDKTPRWSYKSLLKWLISSGVP